MLLSQCSSRHLSYLTEVFLTSLMPWLFFFSWLSGQHTVRLSLSYWSGRSSFLSAPRLPDLSVLECPRSVHELLLYSIYSHKHGDLIQPQGLIYHLHEEDDFEIYVSTLDLSPNSKRVYLITFQTSVHNWAPDFSPQTDPIYRLFHPRKWQLYYSSCHPTLSFSHSLCLIHQYIL